MKKVILGGSLFVGGAIMFSIGILGIADVQVATVSWDYFDDCGRRSGGTWIEG